MTYLGQMTATSQFVEIERRIPPGSDHQGHSPLGAAMKFIQQVGNSRRSFFIIVQV